MTKEYGNVFSLDQAIAEWRQQLRGAGVKEPARLVELENHLREDVERQIKSGTDARAAFEIAAKRIGPATAIGAEFKKVPTTIPRWKRQFMRIYCIAFPIFYLCLGSYALLKPEMSFAERAAGFVAIGLTSLSILGAPYYHRFLPAIADWRFRHGISIGCVVVWMICGSIFVNFILPRLNLTIGQVVVVFLWLMTPGVVPGSVGYALELAARRNTVTLVD
jgi:hypothetical protein